MTRRSYDQFCGLARALDLVGERWTLLLVRDLSVGPQRYSDLLAGLPGIGSGLLAERLKQLEADGIVRKAHLPPPAAVSVYELTEEGHELALAMLPLAVWGARRIGDRDGRLFRADWLMLTLRSRFRPDRAEGVRDTYELHVDGEVVHVRVHDGRIEGQRGPAPAPADVTIRTDPETLLALGVGTLALDEVLGDRRLSVEGSDEALARCLAVLGS